MATVVKELLENLELKKVFLQAIPLVDMLLWLFLNFFLNIFQDIVFFIHIHLLIHRRLIEKRKREIEIVKTGKKNLMYPDNVIRMFADIKS